MADATKYNPSIAWRTIAKDVYQITRETVNDPATYGITVKATDQNDLRASEIEIGMTFTDFIGTPYRIIGTEIVDIPDSDDDQSTFYVGVGGYDNTIAYSYDGLTWIGLGNSIFTQQGNSVAYNGSIWVAVGEGITNTIAYSLNGIDWVGCGVDILSEGREVAWNGTLWVVVGTAANDYEFGAYSYNGIDWTPLLTEAPEIPIVWYSVFWDGLKFVASSLGYSNDIMTSTDGINWDVHTSGVIYVWYNIQYNGTIWVAAGAQNSPISTNTLAHSSDGINWTGDGNSIFSVNGKSSAWNGSRWVIVGIGTNTVAYSDNGIDWTPVTVNVPDYFAGAIVWDGSKFILGGQGTTNMATSVDGMSWIAYDTEIFEVMYAISGNKSKYLYPPIL